MRCLIGSWLVTELLVRIRLDIILVSSLLTKMWAIPVVRTYFPQVIRVPLLASARRMATPILFSDQVCRLRGITGDGAILVAINVLSIELVVDADCKIIVWEQRSFISFG